jgi:hypothetical protein
MGYPAISLRKLFVVTVLASALSNAFGAPENNDTPTTARVTVRGSEVREFDWAKLQSRGRIVYTSSGPKTLSSRMIDDDLQTVFRFSESDKLPVVIVELSKAAQLHRVSTVFKSEEAQVDLFLLNELPKNMNDLQIAKPDASVVELPDERGMVSVDFAVSSARYVALRWKRKRWQDPLTVAEISAFSNDPVERFDAGVNLANNDNNLTTFGPPTVGVISP